MIMNKLALATHTFYLETKYSATTMGHYTTEQVPIPKTRHQKNVNEYM